MFVIRSVQVIGLLLTFAIMVYMAGNFDGVGSVYDCLVAGCLTHSSVFKSYVFREVLCCSGCFRTEQQYCHFDFALWLVV